MSLVKKPKFVFLGDTLFVKYDRCKYGKSCLLEDDGRLVEDCILNRKAMVKKIIIDSSVNKFKPCDISSWFEGCYRVENICGLEFLNTEKLKYAQKLFKNCYKLKSINFKDVIFEDIKNMNYFCEGCGYLEKFCGNKIKAPINILSPFNGCNKLNKFYGDENLKNHLPLYDEVTKTLYDHFDNFGNRVTLDEKTQNQLLQRTIRVYKSRLLIQLEKEYKQLIELEKFEQANYKFSELLQEAAKCNLSAYKKSDDNEINYLINIKVKPDKKKRNFCVSSRDKNSKKKRIRNRRTVSC